MKGSVVKRKCGGFPGLLALPASFLPFLACGRSWPPGLWLAFLAVILAISRLILAISRLILAILGLILATSGLFLASPGVP